LSRDLDHPFSHQTIPIPTINGLTTFRIYSPGQVKRNLDMYFVLWKQIWQHI
jgi:hypothetical protein